MNSVHIPILVEPILKALIEPFSILPQDAEPHWIVDCTLGGGGHTSTFLSAFSSRPELKKHRVLALDQDLGAVERARQRFEKEIAAGQLEVHHIRFGESQSLFKERPVLGVLADLGFSSDQLEDPQRGISFQSKAPLDMRLDPSRGMSCVELLQSISETELEQILREWGEERFSKRIASAIISRRRLGKVPTTTDELVEVVVKATPAFARHGRIHVATRTFQALRIAVNEELAQLDNLLDHVILEVCPGGRIAILSFHSLEDRKVKNTFKNKAMFKALFKKPVQANDEEVQMNSRARSAKLRIAERLSNEGFLG